MIEASLQRLPPDPRWLDFAGFVAPIVNAGDEPAPESCPDVNLVDESRELVGSAADR